MGASIVHSSPRKLARSTKKTGRDEAACFFVRVAALSFFFFHRHRHVGVGGKPDFLAFDFGDQTQIDEMMVALVLAFAAVGFGQLDPLALDFVDSPDMGAIGADDFHLLFDVIH